MGRGKIKFQREVTASNGSVTLWRFGLDKTWTLNSTNYPSNKDYDQNGYDGFFNITVTPPGFTSPLFVGKPNYLDAAPELQQKYGASQYFGKVKDTGIAMKPDRDRDGTYVDIEPI